MEKIKDLGREIQDHLTYGREYFAARKFIKAKECFEYVIHLEPHNSDALNGYASVLCELNNGEWTAEAVDALCKSLKSDPGNPKIWNNLGDYYYLRGEFDEAVEHFEKAVALNPKYSIAYVNLALAYRNTNRTEDTFKALQKALVINASDPWAFYQLGLTYVFRGMRFDCLSDLEKAKEVFISMKEMGMEAGNLPVEKMTRLLDTFLTMKTSVNQIHKLLVENTQYFGEKNDHEVFGCMLN